MRASQGWQSRRPGNRKEEPCHSRPSKNKRHSPAGARIRVGRITATIWERKGEKGAFYAVSFDRRYRDSEGNWKSSSSFDANDLPMLSKAADLAHARIFDGMAEDTE